MNGTNENKVDSLIAELRSFGDRPPPRFAWNRIADELESAVKEERKNWEELQEITLKLLEHERADANRLVEEIASAAKHEREALREAATSKMLEGATIIDNRGQGNAAALREALDEIRVDAMSDYEPDADYLIEKCNAALSVTPRQCDVGSADEQLKRWRKYCENFHYCGDCPANKKDGISADCFANWSQMPYEKGESK